MATTKITTPRRRGLIGRRSGAVQGDETMENTDTIHTTHTADGRSIDDVEVERIVTRDPLLSAALCGSGSSTSCTRDHEGRQWIWAGHVSAEEPGDGTRECRMLQDLGVLGSDAPEDGDDGRYHVYPLTDLGETIRSGLLK